MKTTPLYKIEFKTEGKNCTCWVRGNNIEQVIKKAQKELIGFIPNVCMFEFTICRINDAYPIGLN